MTNTESLCNWPKSYWHITRELMDDNRRYSADKRTQEIVQILEEQLERNRTRTMTFTEDGLMLAIRMIKELYGIAN